MNEEIRDDEIEIDLGEIFHLLLGKLWMIILAMVIFGATALGVTKMFMTPQYESSSMIYILSKTTSISSAVDLQISKQLTVDFETLATSRPVVESVIEDMGLNTRYEELVSTVKVNNPSDTSILKITVTNPDPVMAADISNAMASATADRIAEVMLTDKPSTVEDAVVPEKPSSPHTLKNVAIAALLGAFVIIALIIVNYMMDDRIKTEEDIKKYLGLNTLASIPIQKQGRKGKKA